MIFVAHRLGFQQSKHKSYIFQLNIHFSYLPDLWHRDGADETKKDNSVFPQ